MLILVLIFNWLIKLQLIILSQQMPNNEYIFKSHYIVQNEKIKKQKKKLKNE